MTSENPRGLPVAFISSRQLRGIAEASLGYRPRSVMLSRDHTRNRRIGLVTDTDYEKLLAERDELREEVGLLRMALTAVANAADQPDAALAAEGRDDEMVGRACRVYDAYMQDVHGSGNEADAFGMRAALTAAIATPESEREP